MFFFFPLSSPPHPSSDSQSESSDLLEVACAFEGNATFLLLSLGFYFLLKFAFIVLSDALKMLSIFSPNILIASNRKVVKKICMQKQEVSLLLFHMTPQQPCE
jgi:hypothetical protein